MSLTIAASDFLPGGSLAVSDGDKILPVAHKLLKDKWDFVVASQVGLVGQTVLDLLSHIVIGLPS